MCIWGFGTRKRASRPEVIACLSLVENKSTTHHQVFDLLEGTWRGDGGYPTMTSFDDRETLIFTRHAEAFLFP